MGDSLYIVQQSPIFITWNNQSYDCSVGPAGFVHPDKKREGDNKTPIGQYSFLKAYYRSDRLKKLQTILPLYEIKKTSAWCDAANHPLYNTFFDTDDVDGEKIPSHENLWREDHLYDLIIVTNHNFNPIVSGKGSAIFIHCTDKNEVPPYKPSAGCLKLNQDVLLDILKHADINTKWCLPDSLIK